MERHVLESIAAAMYDGGWRVNDLLLEVKEFQRDHGFTSDEITTIARALARMEKEECTDD